MKLPTLDHYIRQMRNSPYSFGICGTHGNVFIHAEVFKDWFDYKIFHENEAVIA
ncbi:excisionase [Streptococcus pneumoniae]|nr:excisionase [Streptococcus pneumoniae]